MFALSNAYLEEISASTSKENGESAGNGTQETQVDDNDSLFEIRPNARTITDGLRLSTSSLSSVSSLQLGEEASSENIHFRSWEKSKTKLQPKNFKRNKLTSSVHHKAGDIDRSKQGHQTLHPHCMPTISKVLPSIPPVVNPQKITDLRCTKRTRKSSTNSVAILAKYKLKQDRKAAITITLLIALFVVFKVPYAFALLGNAYRGHYWITLHVYEAVTWLYWIKSVTNPFVYAFISKRFRSYCQKLFKRTKAWCLRGANSFY